MTENWNKEADASGVLHVQPVLLRANEADVFGTRVFFIISALH